MQSPSTLTAGFPDSPSDNLEASVPTSVATITIKSDLINAFGILAHAEERLEVTSDLIVTRADLTALQQSLSPDHSETLDAPLPGSGAELRLWCWDDLSRQQQSELPAAFADDPARFCDPHGLLAPRFAV